MDPNLLGRLKKLKELDLSNNLLETLPANLGLSHLRILRCTNNQLGDVTTLHQFPELEELSLEGNPFLTVRGGRVLSAGCLGPGFCEADTDFTLSFIWFRDRVSCSTSWFQINCGSMNSLELLILLPPEF